MPTRVIAIKAAVWFWKMRECNLGVRLIGPQTTHRVCQRRMNGLKT